jgi:tetratricopeptide (TPR) repeat protein
LSKIGRIEEAIRAYRKALDIDSSLSGAHYGLAFLLIKRGESQFAVKHLKAFLAHAPAGPDAERWVAHAQATLDQLVATDSSSPSTGL